MKTGIDLDNISRIILMIIIGVVFFYLITGMIKFGENNTEQQTGNIAEIIDKALVQCYALEGSYPSDIRHLSNYGILFNDQRYIYHYDIFASNIKPDVKIFSK